MGGGLRVLRAGPGATIQDGGRHGYLRFGVTQAGPMDWVAFRTANLALGNDDRAAAIEVPVAGILPGATALTANLALLSDRICCYLFSRAVQKRHH